MVFIFSCYLYLGSVLCKYETAIDSKFGDNWMYDSVFVSLLTKRSLIGIINTLLYWPSHTHWCLNVTATKQFHKHEYPVAVLFVNEMSSHAEYKNTTCQRKGIDIMGIIPCRVSLYCDLGILIFVRFKGSFKQHWLSWYIKELNYINMIQTTVVLHKQ